MYCPTRTIVVAYTTIQRERLLPIRGEVLVEVGTQVEPYDVIARSSQRGETRLIDFAQALSVSGQQVEQCLQKSVGDSVRSGEVIAARMGPVRLLSKACRAPFDGVIIGISRGLVLLRATLPDPSEEGPQIELRAMLRGKVMKVIDGFGAIIEGQAGLIEGIWGGGGESTGSLKVLVNSPDEPLTTAAIDMASQGHILVGGMSIDHAALLRAADVKANGIIVGSVHASLVKLAPRLPLPMIITEGLGRIPMADTIFEILRGYEGEMACLSGSAKYRPRQQLPDVTIIPAARGQITPLESSTFLREGTTVRVTRDPHMGKLGIVRSVPPKTQVMESGIPLRSVEIQLSDSDRVFVPVANLERI